MNPNTTLHCTRCMINAAGRINYIPKADGNQVYEPDVGQTVAFVAHDTELAMHDKVVQVSPLYHVLLRELRR